jgi:hypothetical protein
MRKSTAQAALSIPVILLIAAAVGWAGSQGGQRAAGVPVFVLCGTICFALNWLVFVHAYAAQTERYFDLTGSLTYLSVIVCAVALGSRDPRALLLALLVGVWALRLGTFLFRRIRREGADRRFDALKPSFPRFLLTWTLQGLWVFLTVACALAAITAATVEPLGVGSGNGRLDRRFRDRGHRRSPERDLPVRSGESRSLHYHGIVGLVAPPELLRRDPALDRRGADRPPGALRLAARDSDLSALRVHPADAH